MVDDFPRIVTVSDGGTRHRLSVILAADAAGYSRLMTQDDVATLTALDQARSAFRAATGRHGGRIVDFAGDSVLAAFETALGAVQAAFEVQAALASQNEPLPDAKRMLFRIGIHLGDVIEKADGTIYGDGVNIAARLQALARPGGVVISQSVHTAVQGRLPTRFTDLGEQSVKNIERPVRAYESSGGEGPRNVSGAVAGRRRLLIGAAAGASIVAGAGTWWWARGRPGRADGPTSLAILPFRPLMTEARDEMLEVGMADSLITRLSNLPGVAVRSIGSVRRYAGSNQDPLASARAQRPVDRRRFAAAHGRQGPGYIEVAGHDHRRGRVERQLRRGLHRRIRAAGCDLDTRGPGPRPSPERCRAPVARRRRDDAERRRVPTVPHGTSAGAGHPVGGSHPAASSCTGRPSTSTRASRSRSQASPSRVGA